MNLHLDLLCDLHMEGLGGNGCGTVVPTTDTNMSFTNTVDCKGVDKVVVEEHICPVDRLSP